MSDQPMSTPSVLFVCVKNGGKSQMAAGLMRRAAGDAVDVHSAGTRPGAAVNGLSAQALAEVGVDITGETPKAIDPELLSRVDLVVVLGAEAVVAAPDGTRVVTWHTDEPSERGIDGIERMRLVRDDIAARVAALAGELTPAVNGEVRSIRIPPASTSVLGGRENEVVSGRGTKGVPKVERMAAIIASASATFVERGYANASVAEIAAGAGVTKPLVYSYFKSKAALHEQCVRAAGERILGDVVGAQQGSYGDRAVGTIAAILRAIERSPEDWALVMFDSSVHPDMEEYGIVEHYRRAVSGVGVESVGAMVAASDLPHEIGDERLLAQFWLTIVTTAVTWSMRHPEESTEATIARVSRVLDIAVHALGTGKDER